MRLVIASEIYPPDRGGPATFIKRIAPVLKNYGYDLKIITYADSQSASDGVVRIVRQKNLLFRYWRYFKGLKKLAKDADLIFAQGPIAAGLPSILVKKLTGRKVIIKVVGDVAWERARNKGWTTETVDEFQKNKHSFKINWQKFLRSYCCKKADLIITPSVYLKKVVTGWGVNSEKIKVIYNAFEAKPASSTKEEAKNRLQLEGNIIMSSGRLAPWKGFDTLIDLMPVLLLINKNFKLMIVGGGPEEASLKLKTKNLKLEDKVISTGQKDPSEMYLYYQAADIFILNSGYEGLSHTLLEALSYGLPVIASNIGGNPEVITDEENGLLVEYNNQQQIIDSIKRLSQNKELQEKFKQNALKVLEKFKFETMIQNYLELLK